MIRRHVICVSAAAAAAKWKIESSGISMIA